MVFVAPALMFTVTFETVPTTVGVNARPTTLGRNTAIRSAILIEPALTLSPRNIAIEPIGIELIKITHRSGNRLRRLFVAPALMLAVAVATLSTTVGVRARATTETKKIPMISPIPNPFLFDIMVYVGLF